MVDGCCLGSSGRSGRFQGAHNFNITVDALAPHMNQTPPILPSSCMRDCAPSRHNLLVSQIKWLGHGWSNRTSSTGHAALRKLRTCIFQTDFPTSSFNFIPYFVPDIGSAQSTATETFAKNIYLGSHFTTQQIGECSRVTLLFILAVK